MMSCLSTDRDSISIFIDVIAQCRSEEWRKKIAALQSLVTGLDRQQQECMAKWSAFISSPSRTSNDNIGLAAEKVLDEEEEEEDHADSISLRSVQSNLSAISSLSFQSSSAAYHHTNRTNNAFRHNTAASTTGLHYSQRPSRLPPASPTSNYCRSPLRHSSTPFKEKCITSSPSAMSSPKQQTPLYMQPKELHRLASSFKKLLTDLRSQGEPLFCRVKC